MTDRIYHFSFVLISGTTLAAIRSDLEVKELLNFTPTSEVSLILHQMIMFQLFNPFPYNDTF